jgi:predicted acylesterase/phospholipase RssA
MAGEKLVTVFRSDSADAEEQTAVLRDMLGQSNITAEVASDPEGVFEVRVPPEHEEDARRFIETQKDFTSSDVDLSHDLDMVTVFSSQEYNAEMIATELRSILEAHDIPSVLVSSSMFPNLPYEVRVPRERFEEARQAIAAAAEAGPSAAEQAEREMEMGGGGDINP